VSEILITIEISKLLSAIYYLFLLIPGYNKYKLSYVMLINVPCECTAGIESRWGGDIFRTSSERPWDPPRLLYNGYRVFPGGK